MNQRPSRDRHHIRWWNRQHGKRLNADERRVSRNGYYPGDRVVAIMNDGRGPSRLFGCGVYTGCSWGIPVILLDSGETVYGHECWWCAEEHHLDVVAKVHPGIEPITVAEARERWEQQTTTQETHDD